MAKHKLRLLTALGIVVLGGIAVVSLFNKLESAVPSYTCQEAEEAIARGEWITAPGTTSSGIFNQLSVLFETDTNCPTIERILGEISGQIIGYGGRGTLRLYQVMVPVETKDDLGAAHDRVASHPEVKSGRYLPPGTKPF